MLKGKKIVLGITGSIAAYKSCLIIRELVKRGAEVQVVITPAGKEFITPITLSALTHKPVVSEFFSQKDGTWNSHVDLGLWADAMIIAPATASSIGKMANGIADNMLITTYLSMKAPVFVAPAMDLDMYAHPTTQANLSKLASYGNIIIEPTSGFLASTLEGKGRMEEPENIVARLETFFDEKDKSDNRLEGKKILITAGPTYEKIDPVRFIGNYSSGKMGFALAEECARRGAWVELVCGPVSVSLSREWKNIYRTDVESARQMYEACESLYPSMDAGILCAAVADFAPVSCAETKIKRKDEDLVIHLKPNPDIAASLGARKKPGQILAGFALETDNEETNAKHKLQKKNFDFIVLNSLKDEGAGFKTDTNKITIIGLDKHSGSDADIEENVVTKVFPLKAKSEVAADIVDNLCGLFGEK